MGLRERDGIVKAQVVDNTKSKTVMGVLVDNVVIGSNVYTDEFNAYNQIGFLYNHEIVCHSKHEFVKGDVRNNGVENFWSILKRGISGINHFVSPKHLQRYLDEYTFRRNTMNMGESERFNTLLENVQGRLQYSELIANA